MGVVLFGINPVLAFIQRFVPRLLDGLLLGYIFRGVKKASNARLGCFITGFFSAFLNTLFFMTALVVLFGNTEYMQGLIGGKNIILFVCGFVGIKRSMRDGFIDDYYRSGGLRAFKGWPLIATKSGLQPETLTAEGV